jgi:methionyl-tRNA formyltransferase
MALRVALMFMDGNFVGREYFRGMADAGLPPALSLAVGRISEASIAIERERTGGLWDPPPIPENARLLRFASMNEPALWRAVSDEGIDLIVQGGVGILKPAMIAVPRIGFLNVHPGRLPFYRGNSCPEWALLNGDAIWFTAHLIDAGIDTGPVVLERRYEFPDDWDYFRMRANLYAGAARTVVEAIAAIAAADAAGAPLATPQDETGARYWPRIPETELNAARARLPRARAS